MKQENALGFAQDSTDFLGVGTFFLAIGLNDRDPISRWAAIQRNPCRMINSCHPYAASSDADHDHKF
jgi:hypothetical protein